MSDFNFKTLINEAKVLAKKNNKTELYEALVLQYTNPNNQWGKNTIRDLILLYGGSNRSKEQIYNLLCNMGIEKQKSYDAIEAYYTEDNSDKQEKNTNEDMNLDFKDNFNYIISEIEKRKNIKNNTNHSLNSIIKVCESYIKTDKSNMSLSEKAGLVKTAIRDLNQYDYLDAVKESISNIENSLHSKAMTIEVDNIVNNLQKESSKTYEMAINKLNDLKESGEENIHKNGFEVAKGLSSWVPQVHMLMEKLDNLSESDSSDKSLFDKLNLKKRILNISEQAQKLNSENSKNIVNNIKAICEKYLDLISYDNSVSNATIVSGLLNEMDSFKWIKTINGELNEIRSFVNENYMSYELDHIINNIEYSQNKLYEGVVPKLKELSKLDESELREELRYNMSNYTWVPHVKGLINTVNVLENRLSETTNTVVEKRYSPVFQDGQSTYFYLTGNIFKINENKLEAVNPRDISSELFLTLISVTESFKFSSDRMTYYTGKNTIEFILSESGTKFNFNGREIEINESDDIRMFLLNNGSFHIKEANELNKIVTAYEEIDLFNELDFVNSIKSRTNENALINVIRLNENIYINRINRLLSINECTLLDTASDAVEYVREHINHDISPIVLDLLRGEERSNALNEQKKNMLFERISFLKEQRQTIYNSKVNTNEMKQADKLLIQEIEKYEDALQSI